MKQWNSDGGRVWWYSETVLGDNGKVMVEKWKYGGGTVLLEQRNSDGGTVLVKQRGGTGRWNSVGGTAMVEQRGGTVEQYWWNSGTVW